MIKIFFKRKTFNIYKATTNLPITPPSDPTFLRANERNLNTVDDSSIYIGYDKSQIKTLFLERNLITTLGANQFASITSLETLWLFGNQISTLAENWTNGLANLVYLDLNNNQLTSLDSSVFNGLPKLQGLSLCFNGFKFLDASNAPFSSLPTLQVLDLTGNPLGDSLSYSSFKNLNSLKYLWLRFCGIATLDINAFDSPFCTPNESNTLIMMAGNPVVNSGLLQDNECYFFKLYDNQKCFRFSFSEKFES